MVLGGLIGDERSEHGLQPEALMAFQPGWILTEFWRCRTSPIEYPHRFKPLAAPLRETLGELQRYQEDLQEIMKEKEFDHDRFAATKTQEEALWNRLRPVVSLPEPYTRQGFIRLVGLELPRVLAAYQIYARPLLLYRKKPDSFEAEAATLRLAFTKIERVTRETVVRDGETFSRSIGYLGQPLTFESNFQATAIASDGQTVFQTIFIDESQVAQKAKGISEIQTEEFLEVLPTKNLASWIKFLGDRSNGHQLAVMSAIVKLCVQVQKDPQLLQLQLDNTIEHETGHLRQFRSEIFQSRLRMPRLSSQAQWGWFQTISAHDEIHGFLAECRFSPAPQLPVISLLRHALGEHEQDFSHTLTLAWTLREMLERIRRQPAHFGVVIDETSRLNVTDQILLQMAEVVAHETAFRTLAREMEEYHTLHLDQDFSDEYFTFLQSEQPYRD